MSPELLIEPARQFPPYEGRWTRLSQVMDSVSSGGEFWTPEAPDVRVRGEFTLAPGAKPQVVMQTTLPFSLDARGAPAPAPAFEPGDMAGAMLAHAASSVARFRPITFWGQLDSGQLVSVLAANNFGDLWGAARYVSSAAIVGAHVTDHQVYSAVRFRLDDSYWLQHLADGDSSVVEDDQSTLAVESSDGGNWLVYRSSTPATLMQLEIRVVSSCLALAQLMLKPDKDRDLRTRETQVRLERNGPWLAVCGPAFYANPHHPRLDTLLPPTEFTVERFAKWIVLNDKFEGLAWAVARGMEAPIQLQVQLLTSLIEGFHRRLTPPRDQTWFPDAPKSVLRRVREAAAQAAVDQAHEEGIDPQLMGTRVMNALGQLGDKSFKERAESIVADVSVAVPEIGMGITNLASRLTNPRHSFAHQLPQDDAKEPLLARIDQWTVVSSITPWLLRALLLLKVGVAPQVLREKYLENENFAFYRVNTEIRVRELGWDQPSSNKSPGTRIWTPTPPPDESAPSRSVLFRALVKSFFGR